MKNQPQILKGKDILGDADLTVDKRLILNLSLKPVNISAMSVRT
jgi:hypothetical protein